MSNNLHPSKKPNSCKACDLCNDYWFPVNYDPGNYYKDTGRADILIVSLRPMANEIANSKPWSGNLHTIITNSIAQVKRAFTYGNTVTLRYTYAVRCAKPINEDAESWAKYRELCKYHLNQVIMEAQPKVIVALGAKVMSIFQKTGKITELRGVLMPSNHPQTPSNCKVIATFDPVQLLKNAGWINVFMQDLEKAFSYAIGDLETSIFNTKIGTDYNSTMAILNEMETYIEQYTANADNTKPIIVAIDTETTGKDAEDILTGRTIAVSLAYKDDEGVSFLFDHLKSGYTYAQFNEIRLKLKKLIEHEVVWPVLANSKFDIKWLTNYDIHIKNPKWDIILAEYLLDEDKKGQYSLKILTKDYYPSMAKYEQDLQEELTQLKQDLKKETLNSKKEAIKNWYTNVKEIWETQLSKEEKDALLSGYVASGKLTVDKVITLANSNPSTKKYQLTLMTILKAIDISVLEKLTGLPYPYDTTDDDIKITYEQLDASKLLTYAAYDAVLTRSIAKKQIQKFKDSKQYITTKVFDHSGLVKQIPSLFVANNLVTKALPVFAEMEYLGIRVDRDLIKSHQQNLGQELEKVEEELHKEVGSTVNFNSPDDLQNLLFKQMGFPVVKNTKTNQISVDEEVLTTLAADNPDNKFLENLLTYRALQKAKNTYLENLYQMSSIDGKIHTNFNLNGTATGRLSSSRPNLQNIPAYIANINMKDIFIPDSADYYLVDVDISNAEMRVLTAYSRDETLINGFKNNLDLHSLTAVGIAKRMGLGDEYTYDYINANKDDKKHKAYEIRQAGKRVNFGVIYGITAIGLSKQLKTTEEAAQQFIDGYLSMYPGVQKYIQDTISFVKRYKFVWTFFGRQRRFNILNVATFMSYKIDKQAVNMRIQSTSSDMLIKNIINLHEYLKELNNGSRILLTVHDSILLQIHKSVDKKTVHDMLQKGITEQTAIDCPWLPVEWKFGAEAGERYGSCKESLV